jgi:outer membrane protein OmpA-like peptidoglycan-associated protein
MGFKPAVRFSLPSANFKLGSAELPDLLRQQLDRFAEVLRGKRGSGRVVRIEGHADATGGDEINLPLSQRRAEAVKDYLVKNGADQAMLQAVGMGSKALKVASDPTAAENRRVEIGRQQAP